MPSILSLNLVFQVIKKANFHVIRDILFNHLLVDLNLKYFYTWHVGPQLNFALKPLNVTCITDGPV